MIVEKESVTREEVIRFYVAYDLRKKDADRSSSALTNGGGMIRAA
jgi:hypothetical protein